MSTIAFPFQTYIQNTPNKSRIQARIQNRHSGRVGRVSKHFLPLKQRGATSRALRVGVVAEFPLRKFFFAGIFLLLSLAGLYMYFIGSAVAHIVERKDAESEIRVLSAQISALEIRVVAGEQWVSAAAAQEAGFREVADVAFIPRGETSPLTVALNLHVP